MKNELIKGKKLPVGTIREWKGGKYRKTAQGWEPVSEGKGKFPKSKVEVKGDDLYVKGQRVFVDRDSGAVKLGSAPNPSSSGALFPSSHFQGQLQGIKYVGAANGFKREIAAGKSVEEAKQTLLGQSSDERVAAADEFFRHIGI